MFNQADTWDIGHYVENKYLFLMDHYDPGDKIYLFGMFAADCPMETN